MNKWGIGHGVGYTFIYCGLDFIFPPGTLALCHDSSKKQVCQRLWRDRVNKTLARDRAINTAPPRHFLDAALGNRARSKIRHRREDETEELRHSSLLSGALSDNASADGSASIAVQYIGQIKFPDTLT
jgi:hypothetical protein